MAGSVNKVIILGNLGVDPEVRSFPNGVKFATFASRLRKTGKTKTRAKEGKKQSGTPLPYFLSP